MPTKHALPKICEHLRSVVFRSDRSALTHALSCLRDFDPGLRAAGMARVDAMVAGGTSERGAVITVAEQAAEEIASAAKARPVVRTSDPGYHWQSGRASAALATAEANCLFWLGIVAYELGDVAQLSEAA
jgi:hypothetical protein